MKTNLIAYVEAADEDAGMYLKHGFEKVQNVAIELEPFGGRRGEVMFYEMMIRQPRR